SGASARRLRRSSGLGHHTADPAGSGRPPRTTQEHAMARLDGKVALITGAGGGMGRVAAELFAREGARVAVVDLAEHPEVVETIAAAGGTAITVAADVTDADAIADAVARTTAELGGLHVLYNNAGVSLGDDDG